MNAPGISSEVGLHADSRLAGDVVSDVAANCAPLWIRVAAAFGARLALRGRVAIDRSGATHSCRYS